MTPRLTIAKSINIATAREPNGAGSNATVGSISPSALGL
jgi:hypothetical protein